MKAALYMRVSSEEQISNFSISAQLTALQEYCISQNIDIHDSYIDEGISGTKEDRPAFQKMITDAEKKLFDVILVHKFDRFARRVEISQRVKSRLKKANINVISITEPIEDSPIGFFQEGLLELLSEYFIKNLSNEIKKGQKERASQGHHHGSVPYGYRTKNGEAYVIESEAEIVRKIYELYLQGIGYSKIAMMLNDSGIKTMTGKNWMHHQVDRILRNPVYTGKTVLNGQEYDSNIPIIIDRELYDKAQRDRGIKAERYTYRSNHMNEFLLLGLLRCGECGCAFRLAQGRKKTKKYIYFSYVCNMAARYHLQHKCNFNKHFSTKKLDEKVIKYLRSVSSGTIRKIKTNRTTKLTNIVDNHEEKINKKLVRAREAYLAGEFELSEYSQIKSKLEKELKELNNYTPAPIIDVKDSVIGVMKQFDATPEEDIITRKQLLRTIIEYIAISRNGIDVYFL